MERVKRIESVHALRGYAALAVVVQHACEQVYVAGQPVFHSVLELVNIGHVGVLIFFLMSGFVLPFGLRGDKTVGEFALNRAFRLYPAYWVSLPFLMLTVPGAQAAAGHYAVLANLTIFQNLFGYGDVSGVFWTLRLEITFYGICAVLHARRLLDNPFAIGSAALASLVAVPTLALLNPRTNPPLLESVYAFSIFFAGVLINKVFVGDCAVARKWTAFLIPLLMVEGVALGGAVIRVPMNANPFCLPFAWTLSYILPIPLFLLTLNANVRFGRLSLFLGSISYSLYLLQEFGMYLASRFFVPAAQPVAWAVATILFCAMVGAISFFAVERPAIAIGRSLRRRPLARLAFSG